jgi:hypothetical protein
MGPLLVQGATGINTGMDEKTVTQCDLVLQASQEAQMLVRKGCEKLLPGRFPALGIGQNVWR